MSPDPGAGSGRGGALGTPAGLLDDEAPPSADQEANQVVSGGGVVGPDDDPEGDHAPRATARPTGPTSP
jgi:hypothetical protein